MTPDDFLGQARILVLCNANWTEDDVEWDEFAERDIEMLEHHGGGFHLIYRNDTHEMARAGLDRSQTFQDKIACSDAVEFVLIGKDHGVKRRWSDALPRQELFDTIDAMPMRRYEIKTRDRN